jgi:hypothetical protein
MPRNIPKYVRNEKPHNYGVLNGGGGGGLAELSMQAKSGKIIPFIGLTPPFARRVTA